MNAVPVGVAQAKQQEHRAAQQASQHVWPQRKRRRGTEEWHLRHPHATAHRGAVRCHRQPFATFDPLLQVDGGTCAAPCRDKLFAMRQLRLMQGKEMERVERVWLIDDQAPLETTLMREYDGTRFVRADAKILSGWLPVEDSTAIQDHLYLIDPRGHLMMRFPKDADPGKVKKDIGKLLRASSIG